MNNVERLKVLVLSHMYPNSMNPNNGVFIHSQIKHLIQSGYQIKVISPVPYAPSILKFNSKWKKYNEILKDDVIDGVQVYYPRYIHLPGSWYHSLSCFTMYSGVINTFSTIMQEFKPDVLHSHTATADGYAGLLLKKNWNLPFVCTLRGSDINDYPYRDKLTMMLTKKVLSNADQIISVSNGLKKAAESIVKPKREINVLYNGCDQESFSFNEENRINLREELGISKNETVIVFVGDTIIDKGIIELINSFINLSAKYSHIHLLVLGDGSEYQRIKHTINSSTANNRIHLMGVKPHNEISRWLSAADVLTLPSYHEGLPNVILEAMACGLPVVATNVGGIPEVVRNGENGILIGAKNADSLYRALEHMIQNAVLSKQMGANGKAIIEKEMTWDKNAKKMAAIYQSLIPINH